MNKLLLSASCIFVATLCSEIGDDYTKHVENSILKANDNISSLSPQVLALEGMSSPKVRHLLNNLCSLSNTHYLEVGVWKGSTWISALYKNHKKIVSATAIDNWSEFGGPEHSFRLNCKTFLKKSINYSFFNSDSFKFNLSNISTPINIYFYDGNHTALSQEMAFTYYDPIFADTFIAVIDDWDWPSVHEGTRAAFAKLNYTILFEASLHSNGINDAETWWNGIGIFVLKKP